MLGRVIEDFPMNASLYDSNVLHQDVLERFIFPLCSLDQGVQGINIGLVVLAVVVLESLGTKNFAECVFRVWKFRKAEGHRKKSFT